MNIAAEEAGKRQCILGKPVNPQNLVHRFGALYCCTTIDERRKEQTFMISFFFFFFSKHYKAHNSLGVKTCSLFSQICFSFAVDFLFCLFFPSNLVFGSSVTLQTRV